MSAELDLLRAPMAAYARLVHDTRPVHPVKALARPALVLCVIGGAVTIAATGQVTAASFLGTTACWSFVVGLQLAIALAVVGAPARRVTGLARGLDLFFMGHAPWSLWLIALAAWTILVPPLQQSHFYRYTNLSAVIPLALTVRLVYAFHVQVLRCDGRTALLRTLAHQALTWGITILLVIRTVLPRAMEIWDRWFA